MAIERDYPNMLTRDLADKLGLTEKQVYDCVYKKLGIRKSPDFLASEQSGRMTKLRVKGQAYRFKKGNVPANKGKKMNYTPEVKAARAPFQFKKGHQPHNAYPDGAEVIITYHKAGRQYWKVKVPGIRRLVFKHVKIWVEANGPVPDKHILRFKDGNTLNCVLENIECISMLENMKRNSIARYPAELHSLIHLHKKLTAKIQQHEKQN